MKHTPKLMTAKIRTNSRRSYTCIVDKYSGNRYRVVVGPSFLADREFQYNHGVSERHKIDYNEIQTGFDYWYSILYRDADTVWEEQTDLACTFDRCFTDPAFKQLATEFSEYRGDLVTSDRECAAFILTLRQLFAPEIITTKC